MFFIAFLFILNGLGVVGFCSDGEGVSVNYLSDRGRDVNGDGLFEYLEIQLEGNISLPGVYVLETTDLVDGLGETIPVSAYKKLFLDAGEHIFTILLDGRMIHYSGLNPVNISYIGIISEDYKTAKFLYDTPLSREYNFTEFEPPPDYNVGAKEGDWVRYRVSHHWSSTDPLATEPGSYPDEILFKVDKIEGLRVSASINFHYDDGDDLNETFEGHLERGSQIFPFLMPADMSTGDPLGGAENIRIEDTTIRDILGNNREINHFEEEINFSQQNADILIEQEYFWDRKTGILVKSWFNVTMIDHFGGKSYSNVSFSIYGTNIIPQKTSIILGVLSDIKLGASLNISAILVDFHNQGIEGKKIIFKSMDNNEIGQGLTDADGNLKIEYKLEKPARYLIKAVFMGTEEFLPSENSTIVTVRGPSKASNRFLLLILIPSIFTIAVLLFRARSSILGLYKKALVSTSLGCTLSTRSILS